MFTAVKSRTARALVVLALTPAACAPAAAADAWASSRPAAGQQTQAQDLRMPDTLDAANHYHPTLPPEPVDTADGFDWLSAAIGAAAGTGLMILAVALAGTGRRRGVLRT